MKEVPLKNRAGIIFIACGVFGSPAPEEFYFAKFFPKLAKCSRDGFS